MNQVNTLLQTLIEKNSRIAELEQELKADRKAVYSSNEKNLWSLAFALCRKFSNCPKCNKKKARPFTAKSGYVLLKCGACGEIWNINGKKKRTVFNAYEDNI